MIQLAKGGVYYLDGNRLVPEEKAFHQESTILQKEEARKGTMAWQILSAHNHSGNRDHLKIRFDAMISNDVNYVNIIQTARASGMEKFPMPYVLSNCHNSLHAVGGTISADDHAFGLSGAKKYGGIFLPPNVAVMHQYMRETMAGCGKMILGSDSHTRYGALGTLATGEGGGELVKQLLGQYYEIDRPQVIGVYLTGKPRPSVGPHDVALAIEKAVFPPGYVRNKIMEFIGPGIRELNMDFRNGIDVMTTETACLGSIWETDEKTERFLALHKRPEAYRPMHPAAQAYYDGMVYVDLDKVKPMIALPFHPSHVFTIDEVNEGGAGLLEQVEKEVAEIAGDSPARLTLRDKMAGGRLQVQQGIIAGCSGGTYANLMEAAHILKNCAIGSDVFELSVYPSSVPIYMDLAHKGALDTLLEAGAIIKPCFCGPCFGAGDTPANNSFSIRHTTRNFPNREGSQPGQGQMAAVALMDARSIAATARNHGLLTSAEEFEEDWEMPEPEYDDKTYRVRVYQGFGKARPEEPLVFGPNIRDWPEMEPLGENLLLRVCTKILDPVTSTDDFIPSGETSTLRSNPLRLADFTFCKKDPSYVPRAKAVQAMEQDRLAGREPGDPSLQLVWEQLRKLPGQEKITWEQVEIGSVIYAVKPGDGSAREQAASCQRVLGGVANVCREYATKRYRSNLINWGILPFQMKGEPDFALGEYLYIPDIRKALDGDLQQIQGWVLGTDPRPVTLFIAGLSQEEREILKQGSLINCNRAKNGKK